MSNQELSGSVGPKVFFSTIADYYQTKLLDLISNAIEVKDIAILIEEYAQVVVPNEVKHMKTTWYKWRYGICENQSYKQEVMLVLAKKTNEDKFPEWLAPRYDIGRIGYFDQNNKTIDQYINIIGLDESNGSIITQITGLNKVIVIKPDKHQGLDFCYRRSTIFKTELSLDSCTMSINIEVLQVDDFDFKLRESDVKEYSKSNHFVKDKRLRELRNTLQSLSDVYSDAEIGDLVQATHNKLYKIKVENQHRDLIRLFAKLRAKVDDDIHQWRKSFTDIELDLVVLNGTHLFHIIDIPDDCDKKSMYLEVSGEISFGTLMDMLLFEIQKTKLDGYDIPIHYQMSNKILGGKLYFDGIGWSFFII